MKTKTPRRKRFKVGVRKEYFPRDKWPLVPFTSYMQVFTVRAFTRREAAELIWAQHGAQLLTTMLPNRRRISLDVDNPGPPYVHLGRLIPITVCENP